MALSRRSDGILGLRLGPQHQIVNTSIFRMETIPDVE
jgi:hypothetical protein